MTLTTTIFIALTGLPRWSGDVDEDPRMRAVRLQEIAASVSAAVHHAHCDAPWNTPECRRVWPGNRAELAAAVLAVGWEESHFARYIGEDRCHDGPRGQRCDNGRARQYWQGWDVAAPDLHALPSGDPRAVRVAAWAATRLLAGGARFCTLAGQPTDWVGAFGRYAGASCRSNRPGSLRRLATMRRLQNALSRVRSADVQSVVPEVATAP